MREVLEVNKEGMIPLGSPPRLDSTALGFIIGLWPNICLPFNFIWSTVELCILFVFGIVVCLGSF